MSKPASQIARIVAEPPPATLVPAAEAARQAAAAHVWRSAYEQGARAGWAAGWAAATKPVTPSAEEPKMRLELSEECARLFSRPKPRRQEAPEEEPKDFDLSAMGGGTAQHDRLQRKRRLYGENAEKVVESENVSDAVFRTEASRTAAHYWPVLPLRNSQ